MGNATPGGRWVDRVVEALHHLGYHPERLEREQGRHYYADHEEPWIAACPACYVATGEVGHHGEPQLGIAALTGLVCWCAEEHGYQHEPGLVEQLLGLGASSPEAESPTPARSSSVHGLPWGLRRGL